ncbi:hypothetical protein [Plastoroseomonas hellenica]|uniref:Uncharacterized protein n=1 Tax=Plastoroseomonas hellenica TaxID=2687306 RepID=A0ABS5ETB1_9PROT|nr:hypothetical protein [Plastoroseomonas hellenica]MBR0642572.1 hypothetical protein [Plastoroseomonas hellenica]MBR0663529.1 hypothetical protein [Plastoroseomonas hellenica]
MKRLLIATVLAASTLGLANIAMAAHTTNHQDVEQSQATHTRWGGASSGSFGAQSAAQYNTGNGE